MVLQELLALAAAAWLLLRGKKDAPSVPSATAPGAVKWPTVSTTKTPKTTEPVVKVEPKPAPKPSHPAIIPATTKQVTTTSRAKGEPAAASRVYTYTPIQQSGSNPQTEAAAVEVRKRNPWEKSYWMPVQKPTPAEVQEAQAISKFNWIKNNVSYRGPMTFAGVRQYRAVMHGDKKAVEIWQPRPPFV